MIFNCTYPLLDDQTSILVVVVFVVIFVVFVVIVVVGGVIFVALTLLIKILDLISLEFRQNE